MISKAAENQKIPKKFSPFTIIGITILIICVNIKFFLNMTIAYFLGIFGLLLIMFNFYYRTSFQKVEGILSFNPKLLKIFWLLILIWTFFIFFSIDLIIVIGFFFALILRSVNIILRYFELENKINIDFIQKIYFISALIIIILCILLPICQIKISLPYGIISLNVYFLSLISVQNIFMYFLIVSSWIFPMLTSIDNLLNNQDLEKYRKNFIFSGIKQSFISLILIIIALLNLIISLPIQIQLNIGIFLILVSASLLYLQVS
ncbi:MAG: hypothetical protein ACP6IY_22695 [Promethearchaeia archaeon]